VSVSRVANQMEPQPATQIPRNGTVYTETVVHAPPEQYAADAPYQLAIIDLDGGGRLTARILAAQNDERVQIGDEVVFAEFRDGVAYYRKAGASSTEQATETFRALF
jgi:uncharacterized OB-fold protein